MVFYKSKDLKVGLKVEISGTPYVILESKFVNPGKGQAFNKLKLKNIITNSLIIKTIKIGERLKSANVMSYDARFLYESNNIFYFIDIESSLYYELSFDLISESKDWLKEGVVCSVLLWNNDVIAVKPPRFVELKVIYAETFNKTSSVSRNFKNAKLETGINFKVPLFIKENDIIKIDTEKKIYVSRLT